MLIRVEDITKTYKMGDSEVRALRGVSVDIDHGDRAVACLSRV